MGDPLDPYSVLGVRPGASILEIARVRRRLARRYHPDVSDQPAATVRMQQVNAARALLSDPSARAAWDRAHWSAQASPWTPGATYGNATTAHAMWTSDGQPSPARRTVQPSAGPRSWHESGWGAVAIVGLMAALLFIAAVVLTPPSAPLPPARDTPWVQDNLGNP
jgi:hypothetical protein